MTVPSESALRSREQGARFMCCYLLLIPVVYILVFAPVFVHDRRTSQKALLNFSVVVLIVVFSVMWRVYLRGSVALRTPSPEERFARRHHHVERRRLHGTTTSARDLLERPSRPPSSTTAAVYFSALSSDRHNQLRFSPPLRPGNLPGNAMIVHLTIPIDVEHHHPFPHRVSYAETHLNSFRTPFCPQVVRRWPDNPPPYHVAVDLPVPDAASRSGAAVAADPTVAEMRQSMVESPPPPYDFAARIDTNQRQTT